jgi:hypothetical protein
MRLSTFTHDILLLFAGPIVWAVHFVGIYGLTGVVCARPGSAGRWLGLAWESWAIVGAGLLAAAALGICLLARPRSENAHNRRFLRWSAVALGALALLAIVWETLAVFLVPACSSAA